MKSLRGRQTHHYTNFRFPNDAVFLFSFFCYFFAQLTVRHNFLNRHLWNRRSLTVESKKYIKRRRQAPQSTVRVDDAEQAAFQIVETYFVASQNGGRMGFFARQTLRTRLAWILPGASYHR
jgi:hypothetical protein